MHTRRKHAMLHRLAGARGAESIGIEIDKPAGEQQGPGTSDAPGSS